ncbi:peptidoglycan-binding protein LysM [Testudinibacter sp. P80/BLE/0925]
MADVIDTLFLEFGITGNFPEKAQEILEVTEELEKKTKGTERETKKSTKALADAEKQQQKNAKVAKDLLESITKFGKVLGALGVAIASGVGFDRLVKESAAVNLELDNMSKNLGVSSRTLAMWGSAAEASGGSVGGMNSYLQGLSQSLTQLTVMGDMSALKFFNQLGIETLDASGKARDMTAILLDLSDKFNGINRTDAYNIAKMMGMDEGTFNLLVQGRKAVEGYLAKQSQIYRSNEKDLETSRKLTASTQYLNQQYEALKLMIANAVAPTLLKISEQVEKFFSFLMQHEGLVKGVFYGISTALSMVLIPTLWRGVAAAVAFMAPFLPIILLVAGVAAAFGLLYDDYQAWANGFDSLFNWDNFKKYILDGEFSVRSLGEGLLFLLTGYKDLDDALEGGKTWLREQGFIDETGVSLNSFANGIKNLAVKAVKQLVGELKILSDIMGAVWDGDWDKAGKLAATAWDNTIDSIFGGMTDRSEEALAIAAQVPYAGSYSGAATVNGLSQSETAALIDQVIHSESGGKLDVINDKGYLGLYQFGAQALADVGLIDRSKFDAAVKIHGKGLANGSNAAAHKTFLEDESNWNLAGGQRTFLASKSAQDEAMIKLLNNNAKYLGGTYSGGAEHKAGLLMAAHLKGWSNAKAYAEKGIDSKDGYGTTVSSYYNKGKAAVANAPKYQGSPKVNSQKNSDIQIASNDVPVFKKDIPKLPSIEMASNDVPMDSGSKPLIDMNAPIGGYAVQASMIANLPMMNNMLNVAQPHNINNNQRTEVVINGGVNVNSSSPTISGAAGDFVMGMSNRINQVQYNNGLN